MLYFFIIKIECNLTDLSIEIMKNSSSLLKNLNELYFFSIYIYICFLNKIDNELTDKCVPHLCKLINSLKGKIKKLYLNSIIIKY